MRTRRRAAHLHTQPDPAVLVLVCPGVRTRPRTRRLRYHLHMYTRRRVHACRVYTGLYHNDYSMLWLQVRDEAALQSFVLLKNDKDVLPLRKGARIAVLGPQVPCRAVAYRTVP